MVSQSIAGKLKFGGMCDGPNDKVAKQHKDWAEYHDMMSKFYSLSSHEQIAFMAMFEALGEGKESENGHK